MFGRRSVEPSPIDEMKKHFDLVSIGALILLGPLFVFPKEKWNWLLLAAMAALFVAKRICERHVLPKTPIDAAIGLLLIMAWAGVFVIKDIAQSTEKLAGLVYGVVFFFMLVNMLKTPKRIKIAIMGFLALGLSLAVLGTLGASVSGKPIFLSIESKFPKIPRINLGLHGAELGINPNPLGGTLLLFFPVGAILIFLLLKRKNGIAPRRRKGLLLAALVVLLAVQSMAIFYSRSLGTWISLVIALWLMGDRKRLLKAGMAVALMAVAVISLMRSEPNRVWDQRIMNNVNNRGEYRVLLWNDAWEIVKAHPLSGIGMDQLRRTPKFTFEMAHAHNQFLHTAAELGIPGLMAYLAILIGLWGMTAEVRKSDMPEWMRLTSRGLGTGIFAQALFGVTDAIPLGAKPGIFFWISLAMITSIYIYGRNEGFMKPSEKLAESS
jgi:putative inorganic carbon (HCO3(-)) transporter